MCRAELPRNKLLLVFLEGEKANALCTWRKRCSCGVKYCIGLCGIRNVVKGMFSNQHCLEDCPISWNSYLIKLLFVFHLQCQLSDLKLHVSLWWEVKKKKNHLLKHSAASLEYVSDLAIQLNSIKIKFSNLSRPCEVKYLFLFLSNLEFLT